MESAKNLTPAEDTKARTDLRAAGWIPINAKFANKCAVCGSSAPVGSMIAWNKTTSKIMHYNPCAVDFIAKSGGTPTLSVPPPPKVSVGIGGKKPGKVEEEPVKQPVLPNLTIPNKSTETNTETTTKETANDKPKRKFGFTAIKLSDIKR